MTRNKTITKLAALAALAGGLLVAQAAASADVLSCPQRDGTVRVWDRERNSCGSLSANNPSWRYIGSPMWNDRIDDFGNDDWSRGRSMCLYQDHLYNTANPFASKVRLAVGFRVTWNNIVSSNRWTTSGC